MKKSNSGLVRKKVTVKSKKGRTYVRSMMVAARDIGKRESAHQLKLEMANREPSQMQKMLAKAKSLLPKRNRPTTGALHSMHPDAPRHGNTWKGTSGPGSDHSWFALAAGAMRKHTNASRLGDGSAQSRADNGYNATAIVGAEYKNTVGSIGHAAAVQHTMRYANQTQGDHWGGNRRQELISAFKAPVEHVPQNARKWVR